MDGQNWEKGQASGLALDRCRKGNIGKIPAFSEPLVAFLLSLDKADHGMGGQAPQIGTGQASERAGMIPPVQNTLDHFGHSTVDPGCVRLICWA